MHSTVIMQQQLVHMHPCSRSNVNSRNTDSSGGPQYTAHSGDTPPPPACFLCCTTAAPLASRSWTSGLCSSAR
jgi:hypothetical protein